MRMFNYQTFGRRQNATLESTSEQFQLFSEFCWAQNGKAFDNDALWSFVGGYKRASKWRDPEQWLCSEMFVCALDYAGWFIKRLCVAKDRISPADLLLRINDYIDVDEFERQLPLTWNGIGVP